MPYRSLDPQRIIDTAILLERRIGERFPESGLRKVAVEFVRLAQDTSAKASRLEQPIWWMRALVVAAIAAGMLVFIFIGTFLSFDRMEGEGFDFVQGVEATINTLVLAGIGMFTLARMEERYKRHAVLSGLHALRSMIHVIDMHQLTKDPGIFRKDFRATQSSPKRTLTGAQMARYLDYCSEMLSLSGKLAALYAQAVNDEVVVEAVNDIENLGANLSRKIWQKITMLENGAISRVKRVAAGRD
jgi:hypothetical protein